MSVVHNAKVEPPKNKTDAPIETRFVVSLSPPQVTIDGTPYALKNTAAPLIAGLMKSHDWVSGSSIVSQASRVVASMPAEVQKWIESAQARLSYPDPRVI